MENENTQATMTEEAVELPEGLDLFGDSEAEPAAAEAEQAEAAESTEPEAGAEQEKAAAPETYKVKFNGEEKELTMDELLTAAQKGLNYDHVAAKAKDADKYRKSAEMVERFATAAGVSVEEYLAAAAEQESKREIRDLTKEGMSEEHAKELLALRKEHAAAEKQKTADENKAAVQAEYDRLVKAIKEDNGGTVPKDFDKLPEEMARLIDGGMKPLEAYYKYQLKKEREKTAAATAAATSKARVVGSAKGTAGTAGDSFLSALFGN